MLTLARVGKRYALNPSADLSFLQWVRGSAGQVRNVLAAEFSRAEATGNPVVQRQASVVGLRHEGGQWKLAWEQAGIAKPEGFFDKVLLAIGFGDERVIGDAPRINYWRNTGV